MEKIKVELANYQDNLASIKMIRSLVFQEEQGVAPHLEFDGYDDNCEHLLAYLNHQPVGTTRIRNLNQTTAKIERLAVLSEARGQGIGTKLMKTALEMIEAKNTYQEVVIHAQFYIQSLYDKLGFEPVGDRFEEAEILHIKMVKLMKNKK
ncbi:GNAT family N-acetyltransferase [Crocosphaera sp. XPORK-15E]|uniref:GNAT family N-acetyltransferase n=1 Tax=Crocosphaera sp. XPORK-15E TaxID=3110247 RepID=UPI002B21E1B8|nr:GNAT family N-acetyltransferase [Crocosphaera sp. XPORK-15E]MEA5533329.1 GNAT family N-acetyltransferase [Crocosphaera sp. XPORK-15E]